MLGDQLGRKHPEYGRAVAGLGRVYAALQQPDRGGEGRPSGPTTHALGKDYPECAAGPDHVGRSLYAVAKRYDDAESAMREGADLLKQKLGARHPEYARRLEALAAIYAAKGDAERAEQSLLEASNIFAETLGKKHPEYAETLQKLVPFTVARQPGSRLSINSCNKKQRGFWPTPRPGVEREAVARLKTQLERGTQRF